MKRLIRVVLSLALLSAGFLLTKSYWIFRAADQGWRPPVILAVRLGFSPNALDGREGRGIRLLHMAAASGNVRMVQDLVALGAGVDARSDNGSTALSAAVSSGNLDMTDELIRLHADVNLRPQPDESPILAAVHNGYRPTIDRMLAAGVEVRPDSAQLLKEAIRENHPEILQLLLKQGCSPAAPGPKGVTALMWAAAFGDDAMLQMLLSIRAEPALTDQNLADALGWAVEHHRDANAAFLRQVIESRRPSQ
jgi:ankyrin repeat protein